MFCLLRLPDPCRQWATAQNWYPCRSPERLVGLGDGKYRFSVRSGDAMGVFTPPAFATSLFEVRARIRCTGGLYPSRRSRK